MSVEAVAWLPELELPPDVEKEEKDGWFTVNLPDLPRLPFKPLTGATLAMLGLPFDSPDKDLYEQCKAWFPPNVYRAGRIWVFPVTDVPDVSTTGEILMATRDVGRWVNEPWKKRRSFLDLLGIPRAEARAILTELMSGDGARIDAVKESLEKRFSEAEIEEAMQKFLKQG